MNPDPTEERKALCIRSADFSDAVGGSPGQPEPLDPNPVPGVTINAWFALAEDASGSGWIERFNPGTQAVDLSGCGLTDDTAAPKFVLPPNTEIASGGFLSFDQTRLGFGLNPAGGTIFLLKPGGVGVLDAVPFEAQAEDVSHGRWPDGANAFYPLVAPTPGSSNSPMWISDIVINELMYHPISENDDDQYIDLYNRGTHTVSLAHWRIAAGFTFTFPGSAILAPDSYLVIARHQANLLAKYSNLNSANTLGDIADGQPGLSTPDEPHTSFTLPVLSGAVVLSRLDQGQPEVLDYVDYANLAPNVSYGSLPDGQNLLFHPHRPPGAQLDRPEPPWGKPHAHLADRARTPLPP